MTLMGAAEAICAQYGTDKTYWIAYSGGVDSHVLLSLFHVLCQTQPLKLHAIHIHHGLSPHASDWSAHCKAVCAQLQIDFVERKINLDLQPGQSLEEIAREKRYAVFAEHMQAGDVLLTGHHQDDQAETLLLQLLRGSGVKGLAAMPMTKPFAGGVHARPLLMTSRAEIMQYAASHSLHWIEDESNRHVAFSRNFLRQEIMPILLKRFPSATQTIARSAEHCREAESILNELATEKLASVAGKVAGTLSVSKLLLLSPALQRLVLRTWIANAHYSLPDTKKLSVMMHDVLQARQDAMPCVKWGHAMLRRYRDDVFVLPILSPPVAIPDEWLVNRYTIRYRQPGEVVTLLKRGRLNLNHLMQEWGVPPWERDHLPLVFEQGVLVAAVGYFIGSSVQNTA
jgi:tRNA(Ile)-lysidine synthase